MAITFDRDLLARLGLGDLTGRDGADVLAAMHETLQARVGARVVDRLSAEELAEFEAAMETGEAEASRWLNQHVPDHGDIVRAEFDALCAEVADAAPAVLAELARAAQPKVEAPSLERPSEVGPVLIGEADGPCLIVSPGADTIVAVSADRSDLCTRRGDGPPVVLRLPPGTRVDPATVWCDDEGAVRLSIGAADLCWQVPDRTGPPVVSAEPDASSARPALVWTDVAVRGRGFAEFSEGPWHVTDANQIEVLNRETERRFVLDPLHVGPHSNAVQPHFTPDAQQLVAVHNVRDEPTAGGLSACSIEHLGSVDEPVAPTDDDAEPMRVQWQHRVRPNTLVADRMSTATQHEDLFFDSMGYDPSATRAGLADGRSVHVFDTSDWSIVGVALRPDRAALPVPITVPGVGAPLVCWAGRSLVAAAGDGSVWRLDTGGSTEPVQVVDASSDHRPVSMVGSGGRAVLVHADRRVVTVGLDGAVTVAQLAGTDPLVAADATADGRLLVATRSGLELWSGTVLHARVRVPGPGVVGVAACERMAEWSLLWCADGSIASVRLAGRRIRLRPGELPHQPVEGFTPSALHAVMVDVDEWFLTQERTVDGSDDRVVAAADGWVDVAALCLATSPTAGWVAAGTPQGIDFIPTRGQLASTPRPVDLAAPVTSIASGPDGRSLAAATPGTIWVVRLLI